MKIVGRDILKDNGDKFQIHSINTIGFEVEAHGYVLGGLWEGITFDQIAANIKKAGFNSVRIPFHPKVFENNKPTDRQLGIWKGSPNTELRGRGSLELLDLYIEALEKQGIYFIMDHHNLDEKLYPGIIPPFWYTQNYSESRWINDLVQIVDRYQKSLGFIGIDLKNEPGEGVTWGTGDPFTDWQMAVNKAFYAIERVDQKCLIIVEPFDRQSLNIIHANPPNIPASRLLVSPHIYGPDVWPWLPGLNDPSFPANQIQSFDSQVGDVARKRAVFIGEFGGQYGKGSSGNKDKQWQDAFIDYLKQNDIVNTSVWGYGPNAGDWTGGIVDNSYLTFREDKVNAYKRLITPNATFIGEDSGVIPEPPKPEPEPEPSVSFNIGDVLKHRSGNGPFILYLGNSEGEFFNPSGELCRLKVDDERFYVETNY